MQQIKEKSLKGGGGSIRGISQAEVKGGNAVNLAYALGTFGAMVNLIAIAESLSSERLRSTFAKLPNVDLEIVPGKNGYTVALEFVENSRHVNVMLSDTGDLKTFDGSLVSELSWDRLSECKIIAVVNWAANSRGNDLCTRAFSKAKSKARQTFLDPADVSELAPVLPLLKRQVFDRGLVDIISLNDNELRVMCKTLCSHDLPIDYSEADLVSAVKKIADASGSTVDLHTRSMSVSAKSSDATVAYCHRVSQKIVTGAGDVWDAGDLIGHLVKWDVMDRLRFANAAAGLYVSRDSAEPPSLGQILDFISTHRDHY
ncbi:MAG: carbohydrate kinase family protein [Nitrososphaerales archaeon]